MIAEAPGKFVISGAYSVLDGAPAIVAAVDRYAIADAAKPAAIVTAEVRSAIDAGFLRSAVSFDASALRAPGPGGVSRKLGLGSSAAILVASLAASAPEGMELDRHELFQQALAAHRAAQGGGSGVDVAASVFGGVLACRIGRSGGLDVHAYALPEGAVVEVFASPISAETRSLLAQVRSFATQDALGYEALMKQATTGAEAAVRARSVALLVDAIGAQARALGELGRRAGAPIVTSEVAALAAAAAAEGSAFGPSGAGGGDIAMFVGHAPSSASFRARALTYGFEPLSVRVGAPGVRRCAALFS